MTDAATLMRLYDFFVEDLMAMSDEEILAEAEDDGFDIEGLRRDMIAMVDRIEAGLCSDCPPAGYRTDRTRCEGCPRRGLA